MSATNVVTPATGRGRSASTAREKAARPEQRVYSIYVVELDPAVCRRYECACPGTKPAVYVGQPHLTPEERFAQHKSGYKASKYVRDYGVRVRPKFSKNYGPYETRAEAEAAEMRLAARLRKRGFCVFGGH